MDMHKRAFEFKLADADEKLLDWMSDADKLIDTHRTQVEEIMADETLSDVGKAESVEALQDALRPQFEPFREKMTKREANLRTMLAKVEPVAPEIDDRLRDRVLGVYIRADEDKRKVMLRELSMQPQLAACLATEPLIVTGITEETQAHARRLSMESPDPEAFERVTVQLTQLADAGEFLTHKLKDVA